VVQHLVVTVAEKKSHFVNFSVIPLCFFLVGNYYKDIELVEWS